MVTKIFLHVLPSSPDSSFIFFTMIMPIPSAANLNLKNKNLDALEGHILVVSPVSISCLFLRAVYISNLPGHHDSVRGKNVM